MCVTLGGSNVLLAAGAVVREPSPELTCLRISLCARSLFRRGALPALSVLALAAGLPLPPFEMPPPRAAEVVPMLTSPSRSVLAALFLFAIPPRDEPVPADFLFCAPMLGRGMGCEEKGWRGRIEWARRCSSLDRSGLKESCASLFCQIRRLAGSRCVVNSEDRGISSVAYCTTNRDSRKVLGTEMKAESLV